MNHSNRRRASRVLMMSVIAIAAGPAVAGDEWEQYRARRDSITHGLGNSVAHNIAVQTVDPWPRYVGNNRIHIDGERLLGHRQSGAEVSGIRGYKADRSIRPQGLATQDINSTQSTGTAVGR